MRDWLLVTAILLSLTALFSSTWPLVMNKMKPRVIKALQEKCVTKGLFGLACKDYVESQWELLGE